MLFPPGDRGAVQLGQPGLPGLLADIALHADHVGRGLQPVHRHHHLPGWILAKVISDYTDGDIHVAALADDDENAKADIAMKLTFSQDNQTTSGIWDNVKGGICNKVFVTLKLDLGN